MKMTNRLLYCGMILVLVLGLMAVPRENVRAAGTISLTTMGTAYTQDFNTLANTGTANSIDALNGWSLTESGGSTRDNELYGANGGASNIGDTYSYGADGSPERALGGLRSVSLVPIYGASFTNATGSVITTLEIAYTGEEWRLGTVGRTDQLNFEYSTDATSLTSGTWTGVPALDFITPDTDTTGAKDGNAANERATLSATISGLNIPNGTTFWIRWLDSDASGADDGLAIDDFSLTPLQVTSTVNTMVSLTTDPNPSFLGEWITMTVTVSAIPPGAGTPTGLVQVFDNGEPFDIPAGLGAEGIVILRTQLLSAGDHHLTVTYLGDGNFNTSTSPEWVHSVDAPPSVTIDQAVDLPDPLNIGPLDFTVVFSEPVTDFDDATDVTLGGSVPGTLSAVIVGGPTVYSVAVSGMTGSGTVIASILAGAAQDLDGIANPNTASTSSDNVVTYDVDPPDTQIDSHPADPSTSKSVTFSFSSLDSTASFECRLDGSDFSTCSGSQHQLYTKLAKGPHTFSVRARDAAGNVDPMPASFTWEVDATPPSVVSINRNSATRAFANPTSASVVNFTVTFSEAVYGVDVGDFSLVMNGVTGALVTGVGGSGATRTVLVKTGTGFGTLGLNLVDNNTITDYMNNPLGGAGAGNGNFTGQRYTIIR